MTLNEEKGKYIANYLNLKNGVIVNSGTIAIISALKILDIKLGDRVLINGYCCYSLYEAIKFIGAEPIIIVPNNFFNLEFNEISNAIDRYNIKCFIATHQYGITQDIKKTRESYPNLKIIEDIAQYWNIINDSESIGKYSDIVVTSFGKTKPLSYGQAGAVFSNEEIGKYFDFHNRESRNCPNIMLPFALYDCENINEIQLVNNANKITEKQRLITKYLKEYFEENDKVLLPPEGINDINCYQRFPIIIETENYITEIEKVLNENNILFQRQNEYEVFELDMVKAYNTKIIKNTPKKTYLLIRTRQNQLEDVKKLVRSKN